MNEPKQSCRTAPKGSTIRGRHSDVAGVEIVWPGSPQGRLRIDQNGAPRLLLLEWDSGN